MRAVLDTNVVMSAIFFGGAQSVTNMIETALRGAAKKEEGIPQSG